MKEPVGGPVSAPQACCSAPATAFTGGPAPPGGLSSRLAAVSYRDGRELPQRRPRKPGARERGCCLRGRRSGHPVQITQRCAVTTVMGSLPGQRARRCPCPWCPGSKQDISVGNGWTLVHVAAARFDSVSSLPGADPKGTSHNPPRLVCGPARGSLPGLPSWSLGWTPHVLCGGAVTATRAEWKLPECWPPLVRMKTQKQDHIPVGRRDDPVRSPLSFPVWRT